MGLQIKLAKRLKKYRRQLGLTQKQAAEQSGIPEGTYIQAETNMSMGPDVMRKVLNWIHEEKEA